MKILVPTDFSKFSEYAVDAAIYLAQITKGEIYLLHSYNPPNIGLKDMPSGSDYFQKVLDKKLELLKKVETKIATKNIPVNSKIFTGKLVDNISYVNSFFDPDLILMGSHGVSGKEEWFLGSNAQRIIRKIENNVLVLKKPFQPLKLMKACFVTNFDLSSKVAFYEFLNFIKVLGIKNLDVLTIDTSSFFSQPTILMKTLGKEFKEIAHKFDVKVSFYQDYTVAAGVEHFSVSNEIDFIGISNKEKHPLKRIFQGSNVEMIVNHSDSPVLSLGE